MPDIKIVTEVAGRVCALPVTTGGNVGDGDEIAFVEAMKMEIPLVSPIAGSVASVHVTEGATIGEGELIVTLETGAAAA